MKTIDTLIDEVIRREGDYSNHPADRGGPTRFGVTEATARAHGYFGSMTVYPRASAVEVYRNTYWELPRFDQVAPIYPTVAAELFDTGVNMGPATAAKFLQRSLSLLNRGAVDYPDIAVDGLIGRGTIAALDAYQKRNGGKGELILLKALDACQAERYLDQAEGKPSQEAFLYGWLAERIGQAL
jgi:lysozyme family protein